MKGLNVVSLWHNYYNFQIPRTKCRTNTFSSMANLQEYSSTTNYLKYFCWWMPQAQQAVAAFCTLKMASWNKNKKCLVHKSLGGCHNCSQCKWERFTTKCLVCEKEQKHGWQRQNVFLMKKSLDNSTFKMICLKDGVMFRGIFFLNTFL